MPLTATLETNEWLLLAIVAIVLLLLAVVISLAIWVMHRQKMQEQQAENEWNGELIATFQSISEQLRTNRRGITAVIKRLDGRDNIARDELREAKRLILDVEERLRHEITETKEIVRDTRSQITNIHGGQNNLGNNSIGGGQSQR